MKYPQSHLLAVLCFIYINKRDIGKIYRHDMHKRSTTTFPITKWKRIKGEGKRGKGKGKLDKMRKQLSSCNYNSIKCCALWPNYQLSTGVAWRPVSNETIGTISHSPDNTQSIAAAIDQLFGRPSIAIGCNFRFSFVANPRMILGLLDSDSPIPICTWPSSFIKHSTSISCAHPLPKARRDKVDINFTLR